MSENDAKRFIAENTSDRRSSPVITPGLLKISQSIFGKNSLAPVSAKVEEPEEQDHSDMHEDDYDVVVNAKTGAVNYPRNELTEESCRHCYGTGDGPGGTCWACSGSGTTKY